ncbi:MAG: ATP-binding cassette domain-containing protein, partial [Bacteroidales bacterium]
MSESNEKLTRIANLLSHEDIDLALRLLLDEVYDTDDINLYEQALDIVRSRETGIDDKQVKSMLLELIDTLTKQDSAPLDVEKVYIDLTGITKKYAGNSPFRLGPVDLQAKARYIVGLVGENGNGKTTLLRIIAQDLTSTSGSIRYDIGYEGDSLYTLRSMMAYVP